MGASFRLESLIRVAYIALGVTSPALAGAGLPPPHSGRVFFDAGACRDAKAFSDGECQNAYANAKAEFEEKSPRFATRAECERYFRRCMIGDINGGGKRVTFVPTMRGFSIENGSQRRVLPISESSEFDLLFQPRAVERVNSFVSSTKTAEAQKTWQSMIAPQPSTTSASRLVSAPDGPDEADVTGPARSFPMSPSALQDLKNREKLYGVPDKP